METERTSSRVLSEKEVDTVRDILHNVQGLLTRVNLAMELMENGDDSLFDKGKEALVKVASTIERTRSFMMRPPTPSFDDEEPIP